MAKSCVICQQQLASEFSHGTRLCDSLKCQLAYRNHLSRGGKLCACCGQLLRQHLAPNSGVSLCNSRECQLQMGVVSRADAVFCEICGIHMSRSGSAETICGDRYCRSRLSAMLAERNAQLRLERKHRLEQLAIADWHVRQTSPASLPSPIPVALPSNFRSLELATERKQLFRERLLPIAFIALESASETELTDSERSSEKVYAEHEEHESTSTEPAADGESHNSPFFELACAGCATCRGFCCFNGRDHAFLTADVLRRVAREEQIGEPSELADRFLSFMPEETFEDSCVFHGERGCGLPRRMRADICNAYLCPSLQELDRVCDEVAGPRVYLLAATNLEDALDSEPRILSMNIVESTHTQRSSAPAY